MDIEEANAMELEACWASGEAPEKESLTQKTQLFLFFALPPPRLGLEKKARRIADISALTPRVTKPTQATRVLST